MVRRLSAEERALWRKLTASVQPLEGMAMYEPEPEAKAPTPQVAPLPTKCSSPKPRRLGTNLDGTWDRRLSRGLVAPDRVVDLHGHGLAGAHGLLERQLEQAIESGARIILLITGRPPKEDTRPAVRGAIRAAIGDWLAASRHAGAIAAIRNAHFRHGGAGALYIVLRRRRRARP